MSDATNSRVDGDVYLSDEALVDPANDDYGRAPFASYLAALIAGTPRGTTFRIGILAPWGEGKSSVLRLTQHELRAHQNIRAVLVPSWGGRSVEAIRRRIVDAVRAELRLTASSGDSSADAGAASASGRFGRARRWFGNAKESDQYREVRSRAGDLHWSAGIAALALEAADSRKAAADARVLAQWLSDHPEQRLVVMLDDLDRVDPPAIPDLLMTLREAMDLPGAIYVLALSPDVIKDALEKSRYGLESAERFLEKIIEYPFVLPSPTPVQYEQALERALGRLPDLPGKEALHSLRDVLPRNPRRLKLFLRMWAAHRHELARFDADEMSWVVFHLCHLLRVEFPTETQRLMESPDALESLGIMGSIMKYASRGGDEVAEKPRPEAALAPDAAKNPDGRARFLELCERIRGCGDFGGDAADLRAIFEATSGATLMTRREGRALVRALADTTRNTWAATVRAETLDGGPTHAMRLAFFWRHVLAEREQALGHLADSATPQEIAERVDPVHHLTEVLECLIRDLQAPRNRFVGADGWAAMVQHSARWSQFRTESEFIPIRDREIALLGSWNAADDPAALLQSLLRLRLEDDPAFYGTQMSPEFLAALRSTCAAISAAAATDLRDTLQVPGGVIALLREGHSSPRYELLSSADCPLYAPSEDSWLEQAADAAVAGDDVSRDNLTQLFRRLVLGARGEVPFGDARSLLQRPDIVRPLWRAAVAARLTFRASGTLNHDRAAILALGGPVREADLPIPEWWPHRRMTPASDDSSPDLQSNASHTDAEVAAALPRSDREPD